MDFDPYCSSESLFSERSDSKIGGRGGGGGGGGGLGTGLIYRGMLVNSRSTSKDTMISWS